MESSKEMCDFFESIKALFKFLSCFNCIDCQEDDDYSKDSDSGYIYDIQSESFINPIVNIIPKFDTPNVNEYECDEIYNSIEDHVKIDIIENYMDE